MFVRCDINLSYWHYKQSTIKYLFSNKQIIFFQHKEQPLMIDLHTHTNRDEVI